MSAARHNPKPDADDEATSTPETGSGSHPRSGHDSNAGSESARESAREPESTPEDRLAQLERELADAQDHRLRMIADYQTSQRRGVENEGRARSGGIAHAVRQVIPVLDHFDLALGQTSGMTAEKALEGMDMLRAELNKALEKSGVERIDPGTGDAFDPHQHEAVMRQPADGVERDHISVVFQPGYRLGETVLRPAKVAVAP